MAWEWIIVLIASTLISIALTPRPPKQEKPNKGDVTAPTATEDEFIPVAFGSVWIDQPNVVWYGDVSTTEIKSKGGGKK